VLEELIFPLMENGSWMVRFPFTLVNFPSTMAFVNCVFCSCVILFHVVFAHWPVFHVTDPNGKKFMQDDVADRIQQVVDLQNQSQTIFTLTIFMLVHFLYNLALKLG